MVMNVMSKLACFTDRHFRLHFQFSSETVTSITPMSRMKKVRQKRKKKVETPEDAILPVEHAANRGRTDARRLQNEHYQAVGGRHAHSDCSYIWQVADMPIPEASIACVVYYRRSEQCSVS